MSRPRPQEIDRCPSATCGKSFRVPAGHRGAVPCPACGARPALAQLAASASDPGEFRMPKPTHLSRVGRRGGLTFAVCGVQAFDYARGEGYTSDATLVTCPTCRQRVPRRKGRRAA